MADNPDRAQLFQDKLHLQNQLAERDARILQLETQLKHSELEGRMGAMSPLPALHSVGPESPVETRPASKLELQRVQILRIAQDEILKEQGRRKALEKRAIMDQTQIAKCSI